MTESDLIQLVEIFKVQDAETECVEFKEAKNTYDFTKLGKYFSALSNEANLKNKDAAWLVFGMKDKPIPREIVGSNYRPNRPDLDSLKAEIANKTTNRITFTEIYTLIYQNSRLVLFKIPPAPRGIPIAWEGHYYGRDGEETGALNLVELETIRSQNTNNDWSSQIILTATIDDLDQEAIKKARIEYSTKYPQLKDEVDNWDDITFLNKAKVTINGKITNAAIILLGKDESEIFLSPSQAKITWILKNEHNTELDWAHFSTPLILNVQQVLDKIRNLKYRFIVGKTLFPKEINMYEPFVIRESLHNCIAHQDYSKCGKIIAVEFPNRLVFKNEGAFIPKNIATVIQRDAPDTQSRNPFLINAMFNLNMIDTIGSGIKRMFTIQKNRLFPLPEYTIDESAVSVNIYGEILSSNYAEYLHKNPDTSLEHTIILDKVQKAKPLNADEKAFLKSINFSLENAKPKLASDQVSDQVNDQVSDHDVEANKALIFNSLNDVVAYCNEESNQVSNQVSDQVSDQVKRIITDKYGDRIYKILKSIKYNPKKIKEILESIGISNHTVNKRKYIDPMIDYKWIKYTIPENVRDRNQRYEITEAGKTLLRLLEDK